MESDLINFKFEKLFPFHFQLLGVVFLFLGMVLILYYPYIAPVLLILGILILTAYRGIEFDRSAETYREYNLFLFLKSGSVKKYDVVEKIFVNFNRVSQRVFTRVTEAATIRNVEYNAYLKFGDGKTIYLTQNCH